MAQLAKMLRWPRQELFGSAHRCQYTAGHFVGSATCSKIGGMTSPASRIENPSGGSIHSRSHSAVAEARNTKGLASPGGPAALSQHKILFSSSLSVLQSIHVTQRSPNVPQTSRNPGYDRFLRSKNLLQLFVPTGSGVRFMSAPFCWSCGPCWLARWPLIPQPPDIMPPQPRTMLMTNNTMPIIARILCKFTSASKTLKLGRGARCLLSARISRSRPSHCRHLPVYEASLVSLRMIRNRPG